MYMKVERKWHEKTKHKNNGQLVNIKLDGLKRSVMWKPGPLKVHTCIGFKGVSGALCLSYSGGFPQA
jgi:hypothetical protein